MSFAPVTKADARVGTDRLLVALLSDGNGGAVALTVTAAVLHAVNSMLASGVEALVAVRPAFGREGTSGGCSDSPWFTVFSRPR